MLNFRNPIATVACVRNLLLQSKADEMEIIVVDNHSDDESILYLRNNLKDERVRIVETPTNGGFGFGYNTGARYAHGKYLLVNNPDKQLQKDGALKLLARMEQDPGLGIIGPKILHPDGTRRLSMRRDPRPIDILARRSFLGRLFPSTLKRYLMLEKDPDSESIVEWVVGGCFLIPRGLFLGLGGFDERFFLFFEDTDLCRRCREAGKKILYYPVVVATDKRRRLSGETFSDLFLSKIGRIHMVSAVKYFRKWGVR